MKKINIFYLFLYSIIFDYLKALLESDQIILSIHIVKKNQFFKLRTFYATKNLLELLTEPYSSRLIRKQPYPHFHITLSISIWPIWDTYFVNRFIKDLKLMEII